MRFKNITLWLIMCSFATVSVAQTSVVAHADMPFPIERTIIRDYNFPATVSFVECTSESYFVYADASLSPIYMPIDPNCYVNDFVIDNDTVWFCGKNIKGLGIIGFFDINDFFFGLNNYNIINGSLSTSNSKVTNLTKLVSYKDSLNARHVVAIGKTDLGQYCVVNITPKTGNPYCLYETGEVPANSPETMVAIQTSDYNVFTGGMYLLDTANPALALRAYDKRFVLTAASNIHNYANEVVDVTSQYSFCLDQVALIQLTCMEIGVAAFYKSRQNGTITTFPEGTYIGRYRIEEPKDFFSHLYSIIVPHPFHAGGWRMQEFSKEYIPNSTFNLLQKYEMPNSGSLQSVIYELSMNIVDNASPFQYVTTSDYIFHSIDGHYATPYYLMNGYSVNTQSALVYNMGEQGNNNCLEIKNIYPDPIDMTTIAHYAPLSLKTGKVVFDVFNSPSLTEIITIDCSAKSNR